MTQKQQQAQRLHPDTRKDEVWYVTSLSRLTWQQGTNLSSKWPICISWLSCWFNFKWDLNLQFDCTLLAIMENSGLRHFFTGFTPENTHRLLSHPSPLLINVQSQGGKSTPDFTALRYDTLAFFYHYIRGEKNCESFKLCTYSLVIRYFKLYIWKWNLPQTQCWLGSWIASGICNSNTDTDGGWAAVMTTTLLL